MTADPSPHDPGTPPADLSDPDATPAYVVDVTMASGRVYTYPAGPIAPDATTADAEAHYHDLSRRGVAFPRATAFKVRPAPPPQAGPRRGPLFGGDQR
jgi:hypothetical protein